MHGTRPYLGIVVARLERGLEPGQVGVPVEIGAGIRGLRGCPAVGLVGGVFEPAEWVRDTDLAFGGAVVDLDVIRAAGWRVRCGSPRR